MQRFVGRRRELEELDAAPGSGEARFLLVYGRRRVGKTTLVLHWAERSGRPFLYWVATRDTPAQLRADFGRALWSWAYPDSGATPRFDSWRGIFEAAAPLLERPPSEDRQPGPAILILDEFSYATDSDPALPSNLQAAWDHLFRPRGITVVLTGSHIGTMTSLTAYNAPLYGRFTGQLPVKPLLFPVLREFLPRYSTAERVAVHAVAGGVPAYLERFDDGKSVGANIQRLFVRRTGMFRSEPFLLIGDVVRRETQTYEALLKAVASGLHTPTEIGKALDLTPSYLSPYFKQLESLQLLERRLPATVPPKKRRASRKGRYHLSDPYLRFYFRFIAPHLHLVEQELTGILWQRIREQFRAFVGLTAFEDLCRQWTLAQARAGRLPLAPELVGSHWARDVQVDVVAVDWHEKAILLGECKWGAGRVGRAVLRELQKKTGKVVPGEDWHVHYAVFSRGGFTDAACRSGEEVGADLVDLEKLELGLNEEQ
ncbi:MAG: ATP-binding protein [bacterium]|nr:ATP-binding protein [bacterium]